MDYVVRARTPLFTGDVDRKSDIIRETGIIGGMRWWYEALIRGAGGHACDPALQSKCECCDACDIFGNTNAARTFYLRFDEKSAKNIGNRPIEEVRIGGGQGWYLPVGKMGEFNLSVQGLRGKKGIVENHIPVLLKLMANWGGIGAKNYIGYGIVELLDEQYSNIKIAESAVEQLLESISSNKRGIQEEPSLRNMFFCKVTLDFSCVLPYDPAKESFQAMGFNNIKVDPKFIEKCICHEFLPTAANIRYRLRAAFRGIYPETKIGEVINFRSAGRSKSVEIEPIDHGDIVSATILTKSLLKRGDFVSYQDDRYREGQANFVSLIDFCAADPPCPYCGSDTHPPMTLRNLALNSLSAKSGNLKNLRHDTIGKLGRGENAKNRGSKIATSHFYLVDKEKSLWQMRIWGYIPDQYIPNGVGSTTIVKDLAKRFEDTDFWRHCLGITSLEQHSVDFRQIADFDNYDSFVKCLVLNP